MKIRNWLRLTMEQQSAIIRSSVEPILEISATAKEQQYWAKFHMQDYDKMNIHERN
jgi:hypothetical protein